MAGSSASKDIHTGELMGNPISAALAGAHKAIDSANKFESSVNKQSGVPAKPPTAKSDYAQAREARKNPDEFMGVRSNQAPELNTALAERAEAKKALE